MLTGIISSDSKIFENVIREFGYEVLESVESITIYKSNKSNKLLISVEEFDDHVIEVLHRMFLEFSVQFLISIEGSTALSKDIHVGSVLLSQEMIFLDGPLALWHPDDIFMTKKFDNQPIFHLFENIAQDNRAFSHVSLLSTSKILTEPAMKRSVCEVFNVGASEFLGYFIHCLCTKLDIDYVLVRGVSTEANTRHSKFYTHLQRHGISRFNSAFVNPLRFMTMIKFSRRRTKMRKNLSKTLRRLLFVEPI